MHAKTSALNIKTGGQTTPMADLKLKLPPSKPQQIMKPLRTPTKGSNAQTEAYGKAMERAHKNTQNYGFIPKKYR